MKNRKSHLASLVILFALGMTGPIVAAEPVSVLLQGHDEPLDGYLRRISEARYLLQGENYYYGFPESQLVTVDGQRGIPESVDGSGRLIFTSFYEKVLPDGDVEVWSHNEITNDSAITLTGTDWGAAAWEEEQLRSMKVYDAYNNELPVRIVPKRDGTFRVEVDFVVPVAMKESLGLTLRTIRTGHAKQVNGIWSYTFNVGFNEDRYLTRKIELPRGAELVEAYRGCRPVDIEGRVILLSQRYFPADTIEPLTVTWKMP